MLDVVMIATVLLAFASCIAYVRACELL